MVQQPNSELSHLIVEVSRSHTIRQTHTHTNKHTRTHTTRKDFTERVISSSQRQPLTQHTQETNIHALAGFELSFPVIKLLQTYALDGTANGVGLEYKCMPFGCSQFRLPKLLVLTVMRKRRLGVKRRRTKFLMDEIMFRQNR